MSDDDIDLDRVLVDPDYRRRVIEYLNATAGSGPQAPAAHPSVAEPLPAVLPRP